MREDTLFSRVRSLRVGGAPALRLALFICLLATRLAWERGRGAMSSRGAGGALTAGLGSRLCSTWLSTESMEWLSPR